MCGICGIVNLDSSRPVDAHLIQSMTGTLAHRGPDDTGYFLRGPVGLGHRRLSIIDLAGGGQPIFNEDGSLVIVFNGEIYNFSDLTEELVARGHVFRTRSDTETILHAYEEYGEECVTRLRGMFTFAIWDSRRRRLLLARDRLGKKPLYYYRGNGFLAFASEIKALLECPEAPREIEPESLDLYLSLRYVPGPRTMFKHIFKLQPGHLLVLDAGAVHIRKYWDLEYRQPDPHPKTYYLERFNELLEESVRLRLIAEVPLGVFLSGGLDSSAILAVMSRITGGARIKTFSVGYQASHRREEEANEFHFARLAAKTFGSEHHEFRLGVTDFRDFLPGLVWHLDEPLADPSCIPLYYLSKLAREYVTVILSGEGADEILAGYSIYQKMLALETVRGSLGSWAPWFAARLAGLAPGEARRSRLRLASLPLEARYKGVSRGFRPELKRRLLNGRGAAGSDARLEELFSHYHRRVAQASALDRMLYVDTKVWLPDDILLKGDKMTMANALELRVPFLDHKLVEFAASLPAGLKLNRGWGKFLLRQAMGGVVPKAILKRSKKGFPVPTADWLRVQLRNFTRDTLLAPNSACRLFFDTGPLEKTIQEHEQGRVNRDQEIWTLMVFEFWHKVFIERLPGSGALRTEVAVEVAKPDYSSQAAPKGAADL